MTKKSEYKFNSFARMGLANNIVKADSSKDRAAIDVSFKLKGEEDISTIEKSGIRLWGPGDILGYDTEKLHVRLEPRDEAGDFESNYFPFVEFNEPDFPWRFTPKATPSGGGGLTPWLTLIALKAKDGDESAEYEEVNSPPELPNRIEVKAGTSLPDLSKVHRWAHVQTTTSEEIDVVVSRLLCARKLEPARKYMVFVVPTFEYGRCAGLDLIPKNSEITDLAWKTTKAEGEGLLLPYYFKWQFRTGKRGDFESMVRRLEPRALAGLGKMEVDCNSPGYGTKVEFEVEQLNELGETVLETTSRLGFESALASLDTEFTVWGEDADPATTNNEFQKKIKDLLNTSTSSKPVLTPPEYGKQHGNGGRWRDQLNHDPRHRFAAGLGAEAVKDHQEALMAEAWEQLANLPEINKVIDCTRYAGYLQQQLYGRMKGLSAVNKLRYLNPAALELPGIKKSFNLNKELNESRYPNKLLSSRAKKVLSKENSFNTAYLGTESKGDYFRQDLLLKGVVNARVSDPFGFGSVVGIPGIPVGWLGNEGRIGPSVVSVQEGSLVVKHRIKTAAIRGDKKTSLIRQYTKENKLSKEKIKIGGNMITPSKKEGVATVLFEKDGFQTIGKVKLDFRFKSGETALYDIYPGGGGTIKGEVKAKGAKKVVLSGYDIESVVDSKTGAYSFDNVPPGKHLIEVHTSRGLNQSVVVEILGAETLVQYINEPIHKVGLFSDKPKIRQKVNITDLAAKAFAGADPTKKLLSPLAKAVKELISTGGYADILSSKRNVNGDAPLEIMAHPEFQFATYGYLKDKSQDYILNGLESVPRNTVGLLKTNRRFIEAFLVGLNHEFAAELQWRNYPTDMKGTYFQQFWEDAEEDGQEDIDIDEIVAWKGKLGYHPGGRESPSQSVLLVRGDLLNKYPNTFIYLVREKSDGTPDLPSDQTEAEQRKIRQSTFGGVLPPDVTFLGFDVSPGELKKHFIVFEERVGECRFGLDLELPEPAKNTIENFSWEHFAGLEEGDYVLEEPTDIEDQLINEWASVKASAVAKATLQKPVRVVVDASRMIPQ